LEIVDNRSLVVQEGNSVADYTITAIMSPMYSRLNMLTLPGQCLVFDYDVTDETIFLQLKVEDGKIVVPGGVRYSVLVLPNHKVLSMAVFFVMNRDEMPFLNWVRGQEKFSPSIRNTFVI
jgi:hypothetical protein